MCWTKFKMRGSKERESKLKTYIWIIVCKCYREGCTLKPGPQGQQMFELFLFFFLMHHSCPIAISNKILVSHSI